MDNPRIPPERVFPIVSLAAKARGHVAGMHDTDHSASGQQLGQFRPLFGKTNQSGRLQAALMASQLLEQTPVR